MSQSTKLNSNFYVYRSIRESKSFNPEDKINNLLLGKSIIEKYLTLISTTWNLDFALEWSGDNYCCLYVIEVPKDSNYLILKDSFNERSQNEITLGPGEIVFDKIKIADVEYKNYSGELDNKGMFIFYGKYKSYSLQEFDENFNKLLCEEEKTSRFPTTLKYESEDSYSDSRDEWNIEEKENSLKSKKSKYEEEEEERKREARKKRFSMRNRLFK